MSDLRPPRWAERWVQRGATGSAAGPSVAGDLWEEWEGKVRSRGRASADRWYIATAITLAVRYRLGRTADVLREAPGLSIREVGQAARTLRRSPRFVLVAALSLGGGLGLTTAVFAVINGLLFAPLPWPGGDRIVDLNLMHPREVCSGCSAGASYPAFLAWAERADGVEAIGAMDSRSVLLTGDRGAERVQASEVSSEIPEILGLTPAIGRLFTVDEHRSGGPLVAVLSHDLWVRRFSESREVLGMPLLVDGRIHQVVGVLPAGARRLDRGDVWTPLETERSTGTLSETGLWVLARLEPGADRALLAATLTAIHSGLAAADPEVDDDWAARVTPLRASLIDEIGDPAIALVFLAAAAGVLLLACLNLAALLLARVTERHRELLVRTALGAGGRRIVALVLVETGIVVALALVVALVVTLGGRAALIATFGAAMPPWTAFPLDVRVLLAGGGGGLLAVAACGLMPALHAARGSLQGVLPSQATTRSPAVLRRHRVLLGLQVAAGVALVSSTALSVRSFQRVADFDDLGYRSDGIIGVRVVAESPSIDSPVARASFLDAVQATFSAHPAVDAVTAEAQLFIGSWGAADGPSPLWIDGRSEPVPDRIVPRHAMAVAPDYFDVFQIPLLRGRTIDGRDGPGSPATAVVNQEAARLLWPEADPMGARFTLDNGTVDGPITVVGVVGDIVMNPLSESRRPQARIYFSLAQANTSDVVIRASYSGEAPTPREWAERLSEVASDVPIEGVTTVRQELRRWIAPVIATAGIMGTLGGLAIVLLALGVFGTLSYQVSARTQELGIRRALGAPPARLVHETARDLLVVVAWGVLGGIGLAVLAAGLLRSSLVQIGTGDPFLLAMAAGVVLLAAVAAAIGPLWTALTLDPLDALRAD